MEEKIKNIIEEIRPYLNMDGGDIEFVKYEDKYVYVKLKGHCVECLGQDFTQKITYLPCYKTKLKKSKESSM